MKMVIDTNDIDLNVLLKIIKLVKGEVYNLPDEPDANVLKGAVHVVKDKLSKMIADPKWILFTDVVCTCDSASYCTCGNRKDNVN